MNVERLRLVGVDERQRLFDQLGADLAAVPVGQARPGRRDHAAVARPGFQLRDLGAVAVDAVVFEETIGRRLMPAEQHVGIRKAPLQRPDLHRPREVRLAGRVVLEGAAEVQLSEQAGAVAGFLQQVADRFLAGQELRLLVPAPGSARLTAAPGVIARRHGVARRAHSAAGVCASVKRMPSRAIRSKFGVGTLPFGL